MSAFDGEWDKWDDVLLFFSMEVIRRMDELAKMYEKWQDSQPDGDGTVDEFVAFQGGVTAGAVSMRERAQKLAQTKTGNDLINAIGALSDIP